MLITVSGPPGAGKSSTVSRLAEELGLEHVSGGDVFRAMAAENDMSLLEFNKLAEREEYIDRELDRRLRLRAVEGEDLVLESRLAGWLAGDRADFRIWLDAPLDVRAARIADREDRPLAETRVEERERQASETRRYREYYDIDVTDLSIYDLTVNTARWDEGTVPEIVLTAVRAYDPDADEGPSPVDVDYERIERRGEVPEGLAVDPDV
jgi:cytidylate kinase